MAKKSRMFEFITDTANPVAGECPHKCVYCWTESLKRRAPSLQKKYSGPMRLDKKVLKKKFGVGDFVFVQDMSDLFANCVPSRVILEVLDWIREQEARFLLLTKNPKRYLRFAKDREFSANVILGATVETTNFRFCINGKLPAIEYAQYSGAPAPKERLDVLMELKERFGLPVFVSAEPIMNFWLTTFAEDLKQLNPWGVAVGYDNYVNKLPEPPLEKTMQLIRELESAGIKVYRKTIRKACKLNYPNNWD